MEEAIDKRYAIYAKELATRGDIETTRREIETVRKEIQISRVELADALRTQINWLTGLIVASCALIVSVLKFF